MTHWIQTHGSKAFDFDLLLHGTAEDLEHDLDDGEREELLEAVDLRDIAISLARQCRFAGHTIAHYSVAEHSVLVMLRVREMLTLSDWQPASPEMLMAERVALLHDAAEAYILDVPRPIKRLPAMAGYRDIERRVEAVIRRRFALPQRADVDAIVKVADQEILMVERRDQMGLRPRTWAREDIPAESDPKAWMLQAVGLGWEDAMGLFLGHARRLGLPMRGASCGSC